MSKAKLSVSILLSVFMIVAFMFISTGCAGFDSIKGTFSQDKQHSNVFNIDTGDKIKISMDSSSGYTMTGDMPFTVSKDGKDIATGEFYYASNYESDVLTAKGYQNLQQTRKLKVGDNESFSWTYLEDAETDYLIAINNSNTSVLLKVKLPQKDADTMVTNMKFEKETDSK